MWLVGFLRFDAALFFNCSHASVRKYTFQFGQWLAALLETHGGPEVELDPCRCDREIDGSLTDVELFFKHCVTPDGKLAGDPWFDVPQLQLSCDRIQL